MVRCWCLNHCLASPTREGLANMTDDLEATRHIVEGLGHIGADPAQSAAASRTAARCRVNNLLAGQMVRQRTPRRFSACCVDGTDNSRDGLHPLGVIFLTRLNRELELLDGLVDLLRRLAKLGTLEAGKRDCQESCVRGHDDGNRRSI